MPKPIPSLDSLSLVNFFEISNRLFKKLSKLKVSSISLTPSHFGMTYSNNIRLRSDEMLKSLINLGIKATSIQGILYGISQDMDFVKNISSRLRTLDQLASEFEIPYLILGSANLRENSEFWAEVLEIVVYNQNLMDNEILIENICTPKCQIEFDPFYFDYCKLNVCYDISNHMSCVSHSKQNLIFKGEIRYTHLSNQGHTSPKSFSDINKLSGYLQTVPNNTELIWEISDICKDNEFSKVEFKNLSNLITCYNNNF